MITILIADDEEGIRDLIQNTLGTDPRYKILMAQDGYRTLLSARREHPDLIILDILMPGATGLEVCTALKREAGTSNIKIIILSALSQESDRTMARFAGAEGYVTKPFTRRLLRDEVREGTVRRIPRGPRVTFGLRRLSTHSPNQRAPGADPTAAGQPQRVPPRRQPVWSPTEPRVGPRFGKNCSSPDITRTAISHPAAPRVRVSHGRR